MKHPHLRILATGGSVAGSTGSQFHGGYHPGHTGIARLLAEVN